MQDPRVIAGACVFLFSLWTLIGLRLLRSFQEPIHTLPKADYRYCISPEGFLVGFDPQNPTLAFSFIFSLRNVGNWPIRVRVENFDVRIEDRAANQPDQQIELVIPRIGARSIKSGGFKKEIMKERLDGRLNVSLAYGDPDGPFVRRYRFRAVLHFLLFKNDKGEFVAGSVTEESTVEEDVAIG